MVQTDKFSTQPGHDKKPHGQLPFADRHIDWLLQGFILLLMLLVSLIFQVS